MLLTRPAGRRWPAIGLMMAAALLAPAQAQDARELERITVTGSRLARTPLDNAYPVTILGQQELRDSGLATLGAILQQIPFASGSPLGTSVNQRGSGGGLSRGIESVELRGLGAQRTLVLVNGRRFVPGGNGVNGVVDLGSLPVALIERVEVLKTGASVEYGTDAVAGVINIITRREVEGIEVSGQYRRSDRGDGDAREINALSGGTLSGGQWVAGLRWFDQAAVSRAERGYSRQQLGVSGADNSVVAGAISSAPPTGNYRTSNGRLTLIDGENGDDPTDFRPFINTGPNSDRYNFNPFEDLLQDTSRIALFATARQDIGPQQQWFAEFSYQQRRADTQLASLPFFSNRLAGVVVAADNLFNPFGEELADVRRRLVEAGPRRFTQDNATWRLVLGLDGHWRDWRWDASANHGSNRVRQRQTGDLLADRTSLALGPSFLDGGTPRCGTASQPVADCVPLNVFGPVGSISPAMLEFVAAGDLVDRLENSQTVINFNTSGDVGQWRAGAIAAAFGYAYRAERGEDIPAAATIAGNTTGAARALTRGRYDSHELYAELGLPLLRDAFSDLALDLDLGARLVEYSNFDTASVVEAGLRYQPTNAVVLRASLSQAFRAPTVGELFGGPSQSNPQVFDPCADFTTLSPAQRQNCVDQGVPADGSFSQTGNETPALGGGNRELQPEQGDILTLGLTWRPAGVKGLELNVDLYRIEIDDSIAALNANSVLEQCLATAAPAFCDRIERAADGSITAIRSELQNIATETARGLDLAAYYHHRLGGGQLRHSLLASYVQQRDRVAFPGAAPFAAAGSFDPNGIGAIPRLKAQYRLKWQSAALSLDYAAQWIGALNESGGELFAGTKRRVDARLYHDIGANWTARGGWQLGLGIQNLLDRDPPLVINADEANTDVATYRLLGRSFQLRFEQRW